MAILMVGSWGRKAAGVLLVAALGCHIAYDGQLGAILCNDIGAYGPPACREGETCVSGACAAIGAPRGSRCEVDDDCVEPTRCLDPTAFGQAGAKICSLVCCASTDCGDPADGQVCWHLPGGVGGLCWNADELDRPRPGEGRMGDNCSDPSECRSALCEQGKCVDACCGDSYCPADQICRVKITSISSQEAFTCGYSASSAQTDVCNTDDDCTTAKCLPVDMDVSVCAEPCCSSHQCEKKLVVDEYRQFACTVVDATLRVCAKVVPITAVGGIGATCTMDEECRSGMCVDGTDGRYCSDTCCDDASCGDTSAFACLPVGSGQSWALQCVRK